jgi:hypothetical protein
MTHGPCHAVHTNGTSKGFKRDNRVLKQRWRDIERHEEDDKEVKSECMLMDLLLLWKEEMSTLVN